MTDGELDDAGSICLLAGTIVRIDSPDDASQRNLSVLELKTDDVFRLIRKNDPARSVLDCLVPGYGRCEADRACATEFIPAPLRSSLSQGYKGSLRTLALVSRLLSLVDDMTPLITYLGCQFGLILFCPLLIERESVRTTLSVCPRLETLLLPVTELGTEIDVLNAYEQNGCVISLLAITGVCPSASIVI